MGLFSIGDRRNRKDFGPNIANRKHGEAMRAFATGGRLFQYLKEYCEQYEQRGKTRRQQGDDGGGQPEEQETTQHWTDLQDEGKWDKPIDKKKAGASRELTIEKAARALKRTLEQVTKEFTDSHKIWEWRRWENEMDYEWPEDEDDPRGNKWEDLDKWKLLQPPQLLVVRHIPFGRQGGYLRSINFFWVEHQRLQLDDPLDPPHEQFLQDKDGYIMEACGYPKHPIMRSTDGGQLEVSEEQGGGIVLGSAVIF